MEGSCRTALERDREESLYNPGTTESTTQTTETGFVYVCVDDLSEARRSIEASFGSAAWNPDTIGAESGRLVGRLLQANRLVIDGARCRIAMRAGEIPCDTDCSPKRRFN